MGVLWSLYYGTVDGREPEPVQLKPRERVELLFQHHFRGILGALVPLALFPLALSLKPKDTCMYVYACMALLWIIQPVPVPVVGTIPIFAFPMLGVFSTVNTCKCYLNDMGAMLLTGSMVWCLLNYTKLDQRFATYLMKVAGPSHRKLLFSVCTASALLSMVTLRMLVVSMMIPLVEELLIKMQEIGQEKVYTTKGIGPAEPEKQANKLASVYYLAVGSSASIGSIGFINSSIASMTFIAQVETRYPKLTEQFCYMRFAMFTLPIMIAMLIVNYIYLLFMLEPSKRKFNAESSIILKQFLNDKYTTLDGLKYRQVVSIVFMVVLFILVLTREPVGFDGWGSKLLSTIPAEQLLKQPRYIRDSAIFAITVVILHSLPGDKQLFKYCKSSKKSDLPSVKQIPSLMNWGFSNQNTPWGYLFMMGGCVALIAGVEKSGLHDKFTSVADVLCKMTTPVALLILVILAVVLANAINFVAACGILMPIAINMGTACKLCPMIPPVALGLACSLNFTLPYRDTPPSIVQNLGHVKTKRMAIYGAISAGLCALVLFLAVLLYAETVWTCADQSVWDVRPKLARNNTNRDAGSGTGGVPGPGTGGASGSGTGGAAGSGTSGAAGSKTGGAAGSGTSGAAGSGTAGSAGSENAGNEAGASSESETGGAARSGSGGAAGSDIGGAAGSETGGAAGSDTGLAAGLDTGGAAGTDTGGAAGTDTGGAAESNTGLAAGPDTGGAAGT